MSILTTPECLHQLQRDLFILEQENAPARVLDAVRRIIREAGKGLPPPTDCRHVVEEHLRRRATQNRFGK